MDWQTPAALGVVFITLVILIVSAKKKKQGCGGDCSCEAKKTHTQSDQARK